MATIKIASTVASDVSEATLKNGPARMLTFLQGIADPAIRAHFAPLGWSEERLEEAWSLLNELKAASVVAPVIEANPVTAAIEACETWEATGLVRTRTMLQLTHPEQAEFLFHDHEPAKGMGSVLNAATFLQRRHALEKGEGRKETRKVDQEALGVLEQFGTTKESLKRLQAMVDTAQSVAETSTVRAESDERTTARLEVLRKIYAWVSAWSEMARTVVTRRDQMIRLGIAKRRGPKPKGVVTPPAPVVAPPAPPAPPVLSPGMTDEDQGPQSRAA
ncbi:MAG: hypothetical protein JWP97_4072 [Labilithrix sp.]|nr:hypothetical protein [Labilithrix sp.]